MVQPGQRPGLAGEPLGERRVLRRVGRDHLERHDPVEVLLPGLIDRAHAAAAEQLQDLELRESAAARSAHSPAGRRLRAGGRRRHGHAVGRVDGSVAGQAARHQTGRAEPLRRIGRQRRAALRAESLREPGDDRLPDCRPSSAAAGRMPRATAPRRRRLRRRYCRAGACAATATNTTTIATTARCQDEHPPASQRESGFPAQPRPTIRHLHVIARRRISMLMPPSRQPSHRIVTYGIAATRLQRSGCYSPRRAASKSAARRPHLLAWQRFARFRPAATRGIFAAADERRL